MCKMEICYVGEIVYQILIKLFTSFNRERSGSMVECLTRDRRAAGSSLTGVTALWSLSIDIYPSLVLVQPRKTRPFITERLLMGRKESNQTNKLHLMALCIILLFTLRFF